MTNAVRQPVQRAAHSYLISLKLKPVSFPLQSHEKISCFQTIFCKNMLRCFLMSMRLSQLRDFIHFTPFFSLTYLHTRYFQSRKKISSSEFNVNEIKYWSQKDPFSSLSYQLNRSYIITRTLYIIIRNKF